MDSWSPEAVTKVFRVPSRWRIEQNKRYEPTRPGNDDLRKIKAHIKAGESEEHIMQVFNINRYMLDKIKAGLYTPEVGIIKTKTEREEESLLYRNKQVSGRPAYNTRKEGENHET